MRDITVTALRDLFSMIFGFNNFSAHHAVEAMVAKVSQSLPLVKTRKRNRAELNAHDYEPCQQSGALPVYREEIRVHRRCVSY